MADQRMLSPKQYAERHGISTRTVHRWIKAGRLNVLRLSPRTIRVYAVRRNIQDSDTRGQIATQ